MPLRERIIALIGAVVVAGVTVNPAAAHWCSSGARLTSIERAICSDQNLINKDFELNDLYKKLGGRRNSGLKAEQRNWMRNRNTCTTLGCLHAYYEDRILVLRKMSYGNSGTVAAPPPPPVETFTPAPPPPPPVAVTPYTPPSAPPVELEKLPDIKPF